MLLDVAAFLVVLAIAVQPRLVLGGLKAALALYAIGVLG